MQNRSSGWANLFLSIAVVLGAIVRFTPTILTGSPINDGGMFYIMIEDLKANRFLIPAFTSYNQLDIPFAYPPLSFYAGGLLSSVGVSTIDVLRWLPPLVSTLSILVFYRMASLMLEAKSTAVLGTLAFALMPRTFSWYIMGGGLSRSLGVLFLLLACVAAWALFTRPSAKYVFMTALFGAGAVLSHPETAIHTGAACALIWLFKGRSNRGTSDAALVVLGVVLLTCPWWATVVAAHGLKPFQSALNTGGHTALFWLPWVTFDFAEERFVTLLTVLGLGGLAIQAVKREWFLPAWVLTPFAIEPRSAVAMAAIPLAILAGIGLSDLVLPGIFKWAKKIEAPAEDWTVLISQSRALRILMGYVVFSAFIGGFFYDLSLANYIVPAESRIAMEWVRRNAPPGSRFLVLTGQIDPFTDPTAEWFPALAARVSQNTIQGREWLLGPDFPGFLTGINSLQSCLNDDLSCVEAWAGQNHLGFDFIFLEKSSAAPKMLLDRLRAGDEFVLVYENETAVIFEKK